VKNSNLPAWITRPVKESIRLLTDILKTNGNLPKNDPFEELDTVIKTLRGITRYINNYNITITCIVRHIIIFRVFYQGNMLYCDDTLFISRECKEDEPQP
jgi:hypothetical protein